MWPGLPKAGSEAFPLPWSATRPVSRPEDLIPSYLRPSSYPTANATPLMRYANWELLKPISGVTYFLHFDLSETTDSTGMSMVHRESLRMLYAGSHPKRFRQGTS